MALRTTVKVGSITNLSDARYCAGMGVELIGFNAVPETDNYLSPQKFQEIRGWVTGPLIVIELFGLQNMADLASILEAYRPDYVHISTNELSLLPSLHTPYLLTLADNEMLPEIDRTPRYVVLTASRNVEGIDALIEVTSAEEAIRAIDDKSVSGICTIGAAEIRPGVKDYADLASILEALEEE